MTSHPSAATRRVFLRVASVLGGTVGAAASPFALNLAALGSAAAQSSGDYKALVCLFLFGGNDAANMVLPTDADSWARYTAVRSQAPDPIALRPAGTPTDASAAAATPASLGGVLPLAPNYTLSSGNRGRGFALHPAMPEVRDLFNVDARLAIIANAGPLVVPLTKAEYRSGSKPRPAKLFSHNDQQSTWQALSPEGARIGWGGRLGDLVAAANAGSGGTLFTNISASGNAVFLAGQSVFQYQVSGSGAVAVAGLTGNLFGSAAATAQLRSLVTADTYASLYAREVAAVTRRSIEAQATFQSAFSASTVVAPTQVRNPSNGQLVNNTLAQQLQTVARVIGARQALGTRRQLFFVSIGGFDTHDNQNRNHADLMTRLSHALGYFDTQLGALGIRDQVTLFTASDFGRTFTSNGDGTDHGWGAHHLVMGGAVRGREVVGRFPQVGLNHDDEVGSGNLLPGIAVDQIGATLGRWFGVGESDLDLVFPNLRNFDRNLGFLRT
jgi:uncharacterized protein (DUF1501 family)